MPWLPKDVQIKILLTQPLELKDVIAFSDVSRDNRELVLSDRFAKTVQRVWTPNQLKAFQTWKLKMDVYAPQLKALRELGQVLKRNGNRYETHFFKRLQFKKWKKKAVRALLDPNTQFAEVPKGKFLMGSTPDPSRPNPFFHLDDNETPTWVYLGKEGFQIKLMRVPVTQLLWFLVTGNNPSRIASPEYCPKEHIYIENTSLCPNHPVEMVSAEWAIGRRDTRERFNRGSFLDLLSREYGIQAQLPTEAIRERADRGAASERDLADPQSSFYRPNWFSRSLDQWIRIFSLEGVDITDQFMHPDSDDITHRVGLDDWNDLGISGLRSNVFEFVEDRYTEHYPQGRFENPLNNPRFTEGEEFSVVYRGKFWRRDPSTVMSSPSKRWKISALYGYPHIGFRLAIEVPEGRRAYVY